MRYFGGCCQAEHSKAICPGCCVGCVLTANEPLQALNGIKMRPPHVGDLGLVVLFRIRVRLLCSYVSKWTEPKEKRPPCFRTSLINPCVKTPWKRWDGILPLSASGMVMLIYKLCCHLQKKEIEPFSFTNQIQPKFSPPTPPSLHTALIKRVAALFELENKVAIQIKASILVRVSKILLVGWHLKVTPATSLLFWCLCLVAVNKPFNLGAQPSRCSRCRVRGLW